MYLTILLLFLVLRTLNTIGKDKHQNRKMGKCHEHTNHREEHINTYVIQIIPDLQWFKL